MRVYLKSHLSHTDKKQNCFELNGKKYIYLSDYQRVIAGSCPHAGASLCDGEIIQQRIICPLHGYKFDVRTGQNTSGEGYHLLSYRVQYSEDGPFFETRESL